jgi:hypothetical protein
MFHSHQRLSWLKNDDVSSALLKREREREREKIYYKKEEEII